MLYKSPTTRGEPPARRQTTLSPLDLGIGRSSHCATLQWSAEFSQCAVRSLQACAQIACSRTTIELFFTTFACVKKELAGLHLLRQDAVLPHHAAFAVAVVRARAPFEAGRVERALH